MENREETEDIDIKKVAIFTAVGVVILGAVTYGSYLYSQNRSGGLTIPGGVTYLGPTEVKQQPPTAPTRFTVAPSVTWSDFGGKIYPYIFKYPSTLPMVVFPGDTTDSVAIAWGNIPPQNNILVNVEIISSRDPKYVEMSKLEYVRNWYKFFSGLKGVAKVTPFTNTQGMKGYTASYINWANESPNTDVFFEVPGRKDVMLHFANGILDPEVFNRIIDSVKYEANQFYATPTPDK
ncbi:MAG: hypothetical protein UT63_C0029G0014 [Candidatus Gottesmanbacteria bacterium GW2011_GWC2_39_8]|uniref:Uncharacterized protein n=1 Tax=Candidatus Gottesmanbacteria bacterium GW2011_GWC2_39_8 TaxID=1618450 RepID=A0A0G0PXP4_9BACT|nr:MAG: hypothetical protein UT63_C0029G0014 [Candidatus Gottesmanbacteria bacterium GW2011_GWC2_39_8]